MKVLFVASEASPFIKTGGLGDVIGALPKALKNFGTDARVVIPLYSTIPQSLKDKMSFLGSFYVKISWRKTYCGVFCAEYDGYRSFFIFKKRIHLIFFPH